MANHQPNDDQINRFKALARELECDEDEAAFDDALKQIAEVRPAIQRVKDAMDKKTP